MTIPTPKPVPSTHRNPVPPRQSNRLRGENPRSAIELDVSNPNITLPSLPPLEQTPQPDTPPATQLAAQPRRRWTIAEKGTDPGYLNYTNDIIPLDDEATDEQVELDAEQRVARSQSLLTFYASTNMRGKSLWLEFVTAFRPMSILMWPREHTTGWTLLLRARGIFVDEGRNMDRSKALVNVLFRADHTPHSVSAADNNAFLANAPSPPPHLTYQTPAVTPIQPIHTLIPNMATGDARRTETQNQICAPSPSPDATNGREVSPQLSLPQKDASSRSFSSTLGINGLMKAFDRKKTFGGKWDEDLAGTISLYETLEKMCQLTQDEKFKSLPVMLSGDALTYFSDNAATCPSYEEALDVLRKWYNPDESQSRILTAWLSLKFSEELTKYPDLSEIDAFRGFATNLTSLQRQLDSSYQGDQYLRDRLLTSVDIPFIQASLRDRLPQK